MSEDDIYQKPLAKVVDFAFNEAVVDVFPDMIRRSVPGYDNILSMLGVFAREYVLEGTQIYDLGSSLGASTYACYQQIPERRVNYICIDNSQAMLNQCEANLVKLMPDVEKHFLLEDITRLSFSNASMVILNFTLQFIEPRHRAALLKNIYAGLRPGGCLILSEKISYDSLTTQESITQWHHAFKRANAYTDLEISQKRAALENVLIPETQDTHIKRLHNIGFHTVERWFQYLNFSSFIAIKEEQQ